MPPREKPAQSESRASAGHRGARRKRETRAKLVDAAFRLMAVRGADGVTINQVTEAADVGIGSFYNHFDSKEAIHAAVVDEVFDRFADALERITREVEDPAEIVAVCTRHTIMRARREPAWGHFLLREGLSELALTRGLGARLARDIQAGIRIGRFKVPDPLMSTIAAGGGVLGAIAVQFQLVEAGSKAALREASELPERAAAVVLHGLGLPFDKAAALARRPLPQGGLA